MSAVERLRAALPLDTPPDNEWASPRQVSAHDLAALLAERDALAVRVDAMRALHQPEGPCSCGGRRWVLNKDYAPYTLHPCGFCNHGGWDTPEHQSAPRPCQDCDQDWPCPTMAALDGEASRG